MKGLTNKQQLFLTAISDGHPPAVAAKAANMSRRNASRLLKSPDFRAYIRQRARDIISNATPRAARRLDELMSQDDAKAVAKDAAIALLAIDGIKPPAVPAPAPTTNVHVGIGFSPSSGHGCSLQTAEDYREFIAHTKKYGWPKGGAGYLMILGDTSDPEIAKLEEEIDRLSPTKQVVHERG